MQKKLIALAVAGLVSGGAFAQSNVTIYGVMDATTENVRAEGGTQNAAGTLVGINQPSLNRVSSNSSYIGFKGSEDLGNGIQAIFQLENQIAIENGAGASGFNTRDTFVGLRGGFGTVMMGYLTGAYRGGLAAFDNTPGATGVASQVFSMAGRALSTVGATGAAASFNAAETTTSNRLSNTLMYVSPTFSGFSGAAGYSTSPIVGTNEAKTTQPLAVGSGAPTINTTAWTLGLNYDNGPIVVRAAYQAIQDAPTNFVTDYTVNAIGEVTGTVANNRAANNDIDSWMIGGKYTFGGTTTVGLVYDQNTNKAQNSQAGAAAIPAQLINTVRFNETKNKVWLLTFKHSMGPHDFLASYAKATASVESSYGPGSTNSISGLDDQGAKQWTLRYGYNMSKRTQLYAFYSQINNDQYGVYNSNQNSTAGIGTNATGFNGADPRAFGVGMRHSY